MNRQTAVMPEKLVTQELALHTQQRRRKDQVTLQVPDRVVPLLSNGTLVAQGKDRGRDS